MHKLFPYLSLLFIFYSIKGSAQTPFYREVPINNEETTSSINAITQDNKGYIYIATQNGLIKYNGHNFSQYLQAENKPIKNIFTIGTNLYAYNNNSKIYKVESDKLNPVLLYGMPQTTINSFTALQDGSVYLSTEDSGVWKWSSDNTIKAATINKHISDAYVYKTIVSPFGIICATDKGVDIIKESTVKRLNTANSILTDNIIKCICISKDSRILISGSQDGEIGVYDINNNQLISKCKLEDLSTINEIIHVQNSCYWIGCENGDIYQLDIENTGKPILELLHKTSKRIHCMYKDVANNIWCGTNEGLIEFTAVDVAQIRIKSNYSLQRLTAVACDNKKNIYYSLGKELFLSNQLGVTQRIFNAKQAITCLYASIENNIIIGSLGDGCYILNNNTTYPVKNIPELNSNHILSINGYADTIWLSTLTGVFKTYISKNQLVLVKKYAKDNGLPSNYVYQIYQDKTGKVWMATDGAGLISNSNSSFQQILHTKENVVYSTTVDSYNNLWCATLNHGLYTYNNKWQNITVENGLLSNNTSAIMATNDGRMILVHNKGIDEYYIQQKQIRRYNKRLNPDFDSTSSTLNCITKDIYGNIYVPYEHGFIVFKSILGKLPNIKPGINITDVHLYLKPVERGKTIFNAKENHITFFYEATNPTHIEKLYYKYQLIGLNSEWISTQDEQITFPQLAPGNYTFKVRVSSSPNFDNYSEAISSFQIQKPFWQAIWFIIACFITVSGGIIFIIRRREMRLLHNNKLEKERHLFEYEYLKSQVNPHFLFNSLNTLANLIEENSEQASKYTLMLSDLYRYMLKYKNIDLISLQEEWDILEKYVYIQKCRFGDAIQLKLDIDNDKYFNCKIPPMALQLLVENAIKHNVVSMAHPLIIKVHISASQIVICNNLQPKKQKEAGAGLGLANLKSRYQLLSAGQVTYTSINNLFTVILPLICE